MSIVPVQGAVETAWSHVSDRLRASLPEATFSMWFSDVRATDLREGILLEAHGWSFEAADASFELLLLSAISGNPTRKFDVESWRTIVEQREDGLVVSEATVKLRVDGERIIATAEGNGPVNSLDNALRTALLQRYPEMESIELVDYKVRILDGGQGTDQSREDFDADFDADSDSDTFEADE